MSGSASSCETRKVRSNTTTWVRFLISVAAAFVVFLGTANSASAAEGAATELNIRAGDMVHDTGRDVIYLSTRSGDLTYPNSVVKLDPHTTKVTGAVFVGSDPVPIAMSDDAKYLYVGLWGASKVVRIDLDTFTVDLEIPIPAVTNGPAFAHDIAVVPGSPGSIAVARRNQVSHPFEEGVAIFDGVVMRTNTTAGHSSENSILFGDATTLYGSGQDFFVDTVDPDGVTRTERISGIGEGKLEVLIGTKLYQSNGRIVDVSGVPVQDGQLNLGGGFGRALTYDAASGSFYVGVFDAVSRIDRFDADTHAKLDSINLSDTLAAENIVVLNESQFIVIIDELVYSVEIVDRITGIVTDRHTGDEIYGVCVGVHPFGRPDVLVAEALTSADTDVSASSGAFSINVPYGTYQVSYVDCEGWDYAAEWYGPAERILPVVVDGAGADASMALTTGSLLGLVDMSQGFWAMSAPRTDLVDGFFFGNPGDFPILGDWDCDGVDTPGMYRQSDGYVYLRNSNTQGVADIRFFFGDPGDIPLAGDFNGNGCDTVSIFRPSEARVFIINELGQNDGGLGAADFTYLFGNPGDKPFVGDFDIDFIDTVGLHRESTGLVYFRNSHTQGNADVQYIFGDPGDRLVAGNFSGFWEETPAVFRPSDLTFYIRHTNTQGNADRTETWAFTSPTWYPVAGVFGLSSADFTAQSFSGQHERNRS
jgi:DNA-binding beta-propeller fold protein YncE